MKKFLNETPWYFAFAIVPFIGEKFLEQIIIYCFSDSVISQILEKQLTISVNKVLPVCLMIVILVVSALFFVWKRANRPFETNDREKFEDIICKTIDEYEYVESVQVYKYTRKSDKRSVHIKMNYLTGMAAEGIEVNAIEQAYYYFPKKLYKKIENLSRKYDYYINETDPNARSDAYHLFLECGSAICTQIKKDLNDIRCVDSVGEFHGEMYRVLARIFPAISGRAIESFLENSEVENVLIRRKKTGIIGAIILRGIYVFKNEESSTKKDRIYFVFPCGWENRMLFIISVDGACLPPESEGIGNYGKEIMQYIEKTYNDINTAGVRA